MPRFSVVIPVFNREELLATALESVLQQSYRDFELIIVDDGSSDGSVQVARKIAPSARVLSISNSGPAVARNYGIAHATGQFVAFLDSDDAWFSDTLELFDQTIQSYPSARFIVGRLENVDQLPSLRGLLRFQTSAKVECARAFHRAGINILTDFGLTSVVVERVTLNGLGGFSKWRCNYEDMDLWLRLGNCGEFCFISAPPLVLRLLHDTNVSANVLKCQEGIMNLLRAWRLGAYHPLLARQVSYLAESALRNMIRKIPMRDWWQIYRHSSGAFLRSGRFSVFSKLFAKGLLANCSRV